MRALQGRFGDNQFNVVSIGFNQPADSPQAMKAFAAQHRISQPNWDFLSPPPRIVEPLTRDFGFRYEATPAGFDHVLQVSLVDAAGPHRAAGLRRPRGRRRAGRADEADAGRRAAAAEPRRWPT